MHGILAKLFTTCTGRGVFHRQAGDITNNLCEWTSVRATSRYSAVTDGTGTNQHRQTNFMISDAVASRMLPLDLILTESNGLFDSWIKVLNEINRHINIRSSTHTYAQIHANTYTHIRASAYELAMRDITVIHRATSPSADRRIIQIKSNV